MQSRNVEDMEKGFNHDRKYGYASLASFIARDPDSETFIYRKFDELSARNLLYLQSELLSLEKKLIKLDDDVQRSDDPDIHDAARTWEELSRQVEDGDREAKEKMEVIIQIRQKIKEYHEALLLQSQVAKLDRPQKRALKVARAWMNDERRNKKGEKRATVLGGEARHYLDKKQDLLSLGGPTKKDPLSSFLQKHFPTWGTKSEADGYRIGYVKESSIKIVVAIINTIVAAALLVGSTAGLYVVERPGAKLGMLGGFTGAFALSVMLLTSARRVEIFGATAAYAAVLVVFVSSGNLSGNCATTCPAS